MIEGKDIVKEFYRVQHYYRDEKHENTKLIGIFSEENKARNYIEIIKKKPGFSRFPDGFYITKMILDESYWEDGFSYPES